MYVILISPLKNYYMIYKKKNIPVKYTDVEELKLPYNERPSTIEKKKAKAEAEAAANA